MLKLHLVYFTGSLYIQNCSLVYFSVSGLLHNGKKYYYRTLMHSRAAKTSLQTTILIVD